MSLPTVTRLGHYKIRAKLGAGGMGEVYLAEDTKLNRKVAIKFLRPESTADLRAKRRLMREAQAAAALDHPNICAIHEVAEEVNTLLIHSARLRSDCSSPILNTSSFSRQRRTMAIETALRLC